MGMMLRRHDREADRTPAVNGKPVKQEPKKKTLSQDGARTPIRPNR